MEPDNSREPSVLDYFKAKLTPWRGPAPQIPPSPEAAVQPGAPAAVQPPLEEAALGEVPWRSGIALLLALFAQRSIDPPSPSGFLGAVLYALALAWAVYAYWQGEWKLASPRSSERLSDPLTARAIPLFFGLLFSLLAYLFFGDNYFTLFNLLLWIAAFVFMLAAFRLPEEGATPWLARLRDFLSNPDWGATITRWTLLLALVFGVSVFFRMYRLAEVPPEMVSDHAEKLLDVYDVLDGQTKIFFERNTGREGLQMYITAAVATVFGTGVSFISLKLGTAIVGLLMLPYVYLLGKEVGNRWVGLLAMLLTGIAFWPNVLARAALRFILYPAFVAPTLYYLLRGLRTGRRADFIYSGIALGIGLHGYTPIRILPFVVVVAVLLYVDHKQSLGHRKEAWFGLGVLAVMSFVVFLPLLRYAVDNPDIYVFRAFSRVGTLEQPLPGPAWQIFLGNTWNALRMVNWSDGNIWVVSPTLRPALDTVSAAFFLIGVAHLLFRYLRRRHWLDLFLLLSVPLLMLPSILSLAFPAENPAPNRAGAAVVPVFLIVALALEGLLRGVKEGLSGAFGRRVAWALGLLLVSWAALYNYTVTFDVYYAQYKASAWNVSDLGAVIGEFTHTIGQRDSAWVVAYPYWVDNRLVGIEAGYPYKNYELLPEQMEETLAVPPPKMFLVNLLDQDSLDALSLLYPSGQISLYRTGSDFKNFYVFFVPAGG